MDIHGDSEKNTKGEICFNSVHPSEVVDIDESGIRKAYFKFMLLKKGVSLRQFKFQIVQSMHWKSKKGGKIITI